MKSRQLGIVWPNKKKWAEKLMNRLRADGKTRAAFQELIDRGCVRGNLMSFLYAYTFFHSTIAEERLRRRNTALNGLAGVAGRLERAANAMQKLLDTPWRSEPTFGKFLEECYEDGDAVPADGAVDSKGTPYLAIQLPESLKNHSAGLLRLRSGLRNHLSQRKVGKSFYLAEFVVYLQEIEFDPLWETLAHFVNACPSGRSKDKPVDASLLRKNFYNFVSRNKELYDQIQADVAAYVHDCAQLPLEQKPTLLRWTLNRQDRGKSTD